MVVSLSSPAASLETLAVAPLGKRTWGFVFDMFALCAVQFSGGYFGGVVAATILSYRRAPASVIDQHVITGLVFGWAFWGAVFFVLNYGVLRGVTGSTLGKLALGTKVIRRDGRELGVFASLSRTFLYLVSALPAGVGFLTAFAGKRGNTWHDSMARTVVVLRSRRPRLLALPPVARAVPAATPGRKSA